jgi:hypothetical protein
MATSFSGGGGQSTRRYVRLSDRSAILYKYILLVRVICEKYRLRGEANIPNRFSGEGHLIPRNRYFSQITLTNRIYLFNFAEYLTASKTVAYKHHCRLEPRHLSVFFFTRYFSQITLTTRVYLYKIVTDITTRNSERKDT